MGYKSPNQDERNAEKRANGLPHNTSADTGKDYDIESDDLLKLSIGNSVTAPAGYAVKDANGAHCTVVGRPSRLNDALCDELCQLLREGNFTVTACKMVGIHITTFNEWRRRGADGQVPYNIFLAKVNQAMADSESCLVNVVRNAALEDKDWRAAMELLAKRFPKRWGKSTMDVNVQTPTSLLELMGAAAAAEEKQRAEANPDSPDGQTAQEARPRTPEEEEEDADSDAYEPSD